ncbi:MAG: ATP synthase F0 subunit B [Deltaproteobacteria bacterium]
MKARTVAWILVTLAVLLLAGTAIAATEGHAEAASPWTTWKLFWRVINTIALVALLVYFLKKPLTKFFSERTSQIKKDLEDAKLEREQAEAKVREYEQKIAGMEQELEKMRAELQKSAQAETDKVMANAERMAEGMIEAAKVAAEQEVRKAKSTLKTESVELAIGLAEALIRDKINADDHKKIVQDYLAKVEGMK